MLVPKIIRNERLSVMRNYCGGLIDIKLINYDPITGQLDLRDLKDKISSKTAGVYLENPSYLGFIENQGEEVSKLAHDSGALSVVGVEPSSLGVLTPPGEYGADIVVGEGQPLGIHMNYGGGVMGIIACRDQERLVSEMPSMLLTIGEGAREGEYGFTWETLPHRLHFYEREKGKTFVGTSAVLWGITAAVYLSLLGPEGMRELGEAIMQKSHYAMKLISEVEGVEAPIFSSTHFEEFTVDLDHHGKSVRDINRALLKHGIQGGKDLTREFPELGKSALYCVTEMHTQEDIERLAFALQEAIK
jgi:glycine dehydrogenase subunit 1